MTQENGPGVVTLQCPRCGAPVPPVEGQYVCSYCDAALLVAQPAAQSTSPRPTIIQGMRLRPLVYVDREGTGLPVFRMLVPAGWEFRGNVMWRLDNPGMPATVAFAVWNTHGAEAFEVFPNINFFWRTGGMLAAGGTSFGAEVRPPMGPQQVLRDVILPRYRGRLSQARILREERLPRLPEALGVAGGGEADGARVRISYESGGCRLEEEIYCVVETFCLPTASLFGRDVMWLADYIFSCRAQAGRLDATAGLFRVIGESISLNPAWRAAVDQVTRALAQGQIRHIQHIGQLGSMYAKTGEQIRESQLADWCSHQATYDKILDNVSQTIRGVDPYFDPYKEQVVELPGGYGQAWANNLGEYIVTEDPNFNPNVSSNLHWEPLKRF